MKSLFIHLSIMIYDLAVIGGGAGGCFTAIRLSELKKGTKIIILESARHLLSKVEISGGGRCNVTHACFNPEQLITYYPRGGVELLEPFKRFQPRDMVDWLQSKGVQIKKEADGRMFPESNSSATIIQCFHKAMKNGGIEIRTSTRVTSWKKDVDTMQWTLDLMNGQQIIARNVLISTGGDQRTWDFLKKAGHTIIPPVPSLFTFNIKDPALTNLQGISREVVMLRLPSMQWSSMGPVLITHWGLSGPAILKLSAWAARELYRCGYVFDLEVNWTCMEKEEVKKQIKNLCLQYTKKAVQHFSCFELPSRLWKYLCFKSGIGETTNGSEIGKKLLDALTDTLTGDVYRVTGKSTYKDEFVTAGGVDLNEIDFTRFESKLHPGLFLVGEVLNIDALTGGFNFQAAWTGAELAARALAKK